MIQSRAELARQLMNNIFTMDTLRGGFVDYKPTLKAIEAALEPLYQENEKWKERFEAACTEAAKEQDRAEKAEEKLAEAESHRDQLKEALVRIRSEAQEHSSYWSYDQARASLAGLEKP